MADDNAAWALRPATRPQAGGGHVARCCALGVALAEFAPVTVLIESGGEGWRARIVENGLNVADEAQAPSGPYSAIVLDDYEISERDLPFWRTRVQGPLIQIEDFGIPISGVDLVINATPGLSGTHLRGCQALLGPSYAMLAAPYADKGQPEIRRSVEEVVVGIGVIDAADATSLVLEGLEMALPEARVEVVLGSGSPNVERVAALVAGHKNWRLRLDLRRPWEVVARSDLSISGGGQSLLERMALGIPTIGISVADNQRPALAGVAGAGAAVDLGPIDELSAASVAAAVADLAADGGRRAALSANAQRLVDGQGAARVARHLLAMSGAWCGRTTA
jgi:spore coat polysaccharide biosynthesis predicted glycosyltransferase SpsG